MSATTPQPSVGPSKGRVEAFSDGVFAVAITLLVLDIALNHHAVEGQLWHDLGELKYHYAAYAVSFLTIGIMWVSHHHLMTNVATVDNGLLYRNLLLLAVICFIPFPTGILSEYVSGEGEDNMKAAVGLYGVTLTVLAVAFTVVWVHVYRTPAIRSPGVTQADIRSDLVRAGSSIPVYVIATVMTPLVPWVALAVFAALVVAFAVARPRQRAAQNDG